MMKIRYKKSKFAIGCFVLLLTLQNQIAQAQDFSIVETTFKGGSSGSSTNNARILEYATNTATLGQYGGTTDVQLSATGHFRTELYNGHWYMVDPEGYLYFGTGINTVEAASNYPGVDLPADLKNVGFNHLANWSDQDDINSGTEKMPYVFRELFMQGYKNESTSNQELWNSGVIPVFDPAFVTYANIAAQNVALRKEDPYCIGVFSDNEMPIYTNSTYGELLIRYLSINRSNPNFIAAFDWLQERKGGSGFTLEDITQADYDEFHGFILSNYYRIVNTAIKTYAPDMLYLGSRLHGAAKNYESIYKESGPYIDVFSVNWYSGYETDASLLKMWTEESGKPFIISEFYAKGFDAGLANDQGAGYNVPTQADRAVYFENSAINLLESTGCVGYQWFRFQDDSSNKGVINANDEWYSELKNSLIKINKDIYNLRNFLTEGTVVTPPVGSSIVQVSEDSFVRGLSPKGEGDNSDKNYDGDLLAVKESPTDAAFSRRTFLKFDLTNYESINSATLNFSGGQTSGFSFPITVYRIDDADDTWSETTLTWNNAPTVAGEITTFVTNGDTSGDYDIYTLDLTSYIQTELSEGNKIISLVLMNATEKNYLFSILNSEGTPDVANNKITPNLNIDGSLLGVKNNEEFQFSIYPNPLKINNELTINSPSLIQNISVFNVHGVLVQKVNDIDANEYSLNVSSKTSGVYFIQVENTNGSFSTRQLIIE